MMIKKLSILLLVVAHLNVVVAMDPNAANGGAAGKAKVVCLPPAKRIAFSDFTKQADKVGELDEAAKRKLLEGIKAGLLEAQENNWASLVREYTKIREVVAQALGVERNFPINAELEAAEKAKSDAAEAARRQEQPKDKQTEEEKQLGADSKAKRDAAIQAKVAVAAQAAQDAQQAQADALNMPVDTTKPVDTAKPTAAQAEKDKQEREKNYLEKARNMVAQCKSEELPQCIAFLETGINDIRRSGKFVTEYVKALVTLKAEAQAKLVAAKQAVAGAPAGDKPDVNAKVRGNNANPDTNAGWSRYFTVRNIIAGAGLVAVMYLLNRHVVQPRLAQNDNKKKA